MEVKASPVPQHSRKELKCVVRISLDAKLKYTWGFRAVCLFEILSQLAKTQIFISFRFYLSFVVKKNGTMKIAVFHFSFYQFGRTR